MWTVQLYEIIDTADVYCLVMGLAKTDILTTLCEEGISTETEARKFFRQLLSAVEFMHSHDIVHRDLKVENLMLDRMDMLKIIDFGLSNSLAGKEFLDTQCGSMAYSAPELLCKKPYGKEVDIWSA